MDQSWHQYVSINQNNAVVDISKSLNAYETWKVSFCVYTHDAWNLVNVEKCVLDMLQTNRNECARKAVSSV